MLLSKRISTHFLLLLYTSTIAILLVILLSWISSCTALPQSSALHRPLLANDEIFLAPGHSLQSQGSGARTRTVWRQHTEACREHIGTVQWRTYSHSLVPAGCKSSPPQRQLDQNYSKIHSVRSYWKWFNNKQREKDWNNKVKGGYMTLDSFWSST